MRIVHHLAKSANQKSESQPGLGWGVSGESYGADKSKPLPFFAECRDTRTNGGGATKSVFMALAARVNPAKGSSVPSLGTDNSP